MRQPTLPAAIFCACLMLAACSADKTATPQQQAGNESLPKPDAAGGSVTGMPNPGTPSVLPAPADNLATDNEDPDIATEDSSAVDPNLPVAQPTTTIEGSPGTLPPDTMPTMPVPPVQPNQQTQATPPPQS